MVGSGDQDARPEVPAGRIGLGRIYFGRMLVIQSWAKKTRKAIATTHISQ
jgi:hypothetical protein